MNKLVESIIKPILGEQKDIKKVIAVYPGRFQPFGPHHKAVYQLLNKKFDDVYILTSNKQGLPRHPLSFKQKKAHMSKMGVSTSKIFVETSPYRPKNLPKKFNSDTTAFVFVVGKKDASRLSGGKYFQDYKKNKSNLAGYEEHGYVLIAPHVSVKAGGMEVSGTSMRELLGSPKYEDDRERRFKKMFGYFNEKIFKLMTNQFSKIFEQDFDAKDVVIYTPTHKMKKNKKWFDGKGKEILHDLEEDSGWPLGTGSTIGHGYPSEEDLKKWKKKTNKARSRTDSNKKYHFDPVNEGKEGEIEDTIRQAFLMDKWKLTKRQYERLVKDLKKRYGNTVDKVVKTLLKYQYIEPQGSKIVWNESIELPVEIGDTVLMGRFKNKKVVVKTIDWNEKGDLLINGRSAMKMRLIKKPNITPVKNPYVTEEQILHFIQNIDFTKILDESSTSGAPADDGPSYTYGNFRTYKWRNDKEAEKLGFKVVNYILKPKHKDDKNYRLYPDGPVDSVSFFPAGIGAGGTPNNQTNLSGRQGYNRWLKHMKKVAQTVGYKLNDFLKYSKELKKQTEKSSIQTLKTQKKEFTGEMPPKDEDDQHEDYAIVEEQILTKQWWKSIITEDWWTDMSSQEQAEYIKTHPTSKKTKAPKTKMPKFDMPKIKMPKIKLDPEKIKKAAENQASKRSARDMSVKERKHELSFISNRSQKIKPIIKKLNNLHEEYDKIFLPLQEKYEKAESAGNTQESERLLKQIEEMSKEHDEKVKPYLKAEEEFWELEDREKELKYSPPIKRKSKLKKRKDGGKIEMLDEEGIKHIWYNKDNPKDPTQEKTLKHLDKQWKDSPLSKLSEKEKATTYDYIASWKGLGAYEARERLGDKYVNKRNSHMNELAGKSIIQTPPPKEISRGMTLKKHKVKRMLEKYKVGSDVNLDFPQGFTGTSTISTSFGNPPSDEDVSFVIKIKPNSKGQLRGLHIDGITNDSDYKKYLLLKSEFLSSCVSYLHVKVKKTIEIAFGGE